MNCPGGDSGPPDWIESQSWGRQMDSFHAVILGLVQGLTEFLPVSSSGHLVLGQYFFNFREPKILFDVVLHLGTLVAVVVVFQSEIRALLAELFSLPGHLKGRGAWGKAWRERPMFRLLALIVVGTIPTAFLGFAFRDLFESLFSSPPAVGAALLVTGTILFLTRWSPDRGRTVGRFRVSDALTIGLAQGLAITPGISRSGFTISVGQFLGLDRELAARYSFLLSIPAILGALVLQLTNSSTHGASAGVLTAGFTAALVSGLGALIVLLRVVRKGRLHYFSFYCWVVGLLTLGLTW